MEQPARASARAFLFARRELARGSLTGATGFTADLAGFDLVNGDGTPCGPTGPCTVTVPSGQYLWVTWHLQSNLIGTSSLPISATCPGNEAIAATVTLTDGAGMVTSCGASASGYLKQ
jgi:hypothetical protein